MSDQIALVPTSEELRSQRLLIRAADLAKVLMPVMSTLHRRHCKITAVSFEAADDDTNQGHLEIRLTCSSARSHTIPLWLANIVGVLAVEDLT